MKVCSLGAGTFRRVVCVVLSVSMVTAPSAAVMAQESEVTDAETLLAPTEVAKDQTLLAPPEMAKLDLAYVTPQAVAVAVLRPRQLMTGPGAEMMPVEVASAAGLEYLGVDPVDIVEVIGFAEPPLAGPPQYGLVIRLARPMRVTDLDEQLTANTLSDVYEDRPYLVSLQAMLPSFYMPDDTTLLVAPDATLRRMLAQGTRAEQSPLLDRLRDIPAGNDGYASVDLITLRPLLGMFVAQAQQSGDIPPELKGLLETPSLIRGVDLTMNLVTAGWSSLVVRCDDEASAQRVDSIIGTALEYAKTKIHDDMLREMPAEDPVAQAYARYLERTSTRWIELVRPQREGDTLTLFRVDNSDPSQQQLTNVAVIGVLVALLMPAVQSARAAARRAQSMNNLRELMLALHNYHATHRALPAQASFDADGKPLLSWRVHVLPFLEEMALYKEFHLDEPWDSPHNRQLIPRMPEVFANPTLPLEPGKTSYLAVVGENCAFDGSQNGIGFRDFTDGTANTIMLVEANADQAAIWTKPADLKFDPAKPKAGLGGVRPAAWVAGFADGSVRPIANDISDELLKNLFTRNSGEAVNLNE